MKRLYVFDLDGTVYRGSEPVPSASMVVQGLIERGAMVRYFTNNSAARPDQVAEKLRSMGVPCEPSWVYGTGQMAANECLKRGYMRVFVVGETGLYETIKESGIELVDQRPDAVVVGICRSFDYPRLDKAARFVRNGAALIVTNRDATYPIEGGDEQPGAGAIAAAIEIASGVTVEALGKPNPLILNTILSDSNVSPNKTLVIGDRMDTDIECGRRAGCDTWLALSGVTKELPNGQAGGADLRELMKS